MKYFISIGLAPAIAAGLLVIWILILAIPGCWLMFVFLAMPVLTTLPWSAVGLVVCISIALHRCRWWVHLSVWLSAAALALLVGYPSMGNSAASTARRWLDFAFYRPRLDVEVRAQHLDGQWPALARVTIDGFGSMSNGIAYDESGEMALPAGQQSPRWRDAAAGTELAGTTWNALRLYGHYFWWEDQ